MLATSAHVAQLHVQQAVLGGYFLNKIEGTGVENPNQFVKEMCFMFVTGLTSISTKGGKPSYSQFFDVGCRSLEKLFDPMMFITV